jgi:hypothetical protein
MKIIAFVTAMLATTAADPSNGAPVHFHYHHHDATVIMQNDNVPFFLEEGDNSIGRSDSFTCKSAAGCVVIMEASILEQDSNYQGILCSYVDGVAGAPGCPLDITNSGPIRISAHQQMFVEPGLHSITTVRHIDGSGQGSSEVFGWATEYTIYEKEIGTPAPAN